MKINEHTALSTSKLLLVPYTKHHVETYHTWMQDADLQTATASEPLTLEEEYEMQRSWRRDHDKLTFIICLPLESPQERTRVDDDDDGVAAKMIGDVNLFLYPLHNDDDDEISSDQHLSNVEAAGGRESPTDTRSTCPQQVVGELELMIARKDLQGQGYGRASLVAFMRYILTNWIHIAEEYRVSAAPINPQQQQQLSSQSYDLAYLRAKINVDNARSIALFTSLGFEQVGQPNYFGELELRWQRRELEDLTRMKGFEEPGILEYD